MKILGIDIGYDRCGYAVFDLRSPIGPIDYGLIVTEKNVEMRLRLRKLKNALYENLSSHNIELVVLEKLFYNRKNTVFEKICMAKGVIMEFFADIKVIELEPKKVKKDILGSGDLNKSDIKRILKRIIHVDNMDRLKDDVIDAILLGYYGVRLVQFYGIK
ncbi:MAG: crossover junction endodeoxyribonuclease RuvC [Candidatus Dojkabacteria bacterium]|nr:crossover junction endodeoxyribonuclease RuvC [Candidatus Dojkabacteria bacterium]